MKANKQTLVLPVLFISLGTGWLLTTIGVAPKIDWVLTLTLATAGILTFIVAEFDKISFVLGAMLLVVSVFSLLRQTNRLSLDVEIPLLLIVLGVLLLVARSSRIPTPKWLQEDGSDREGRVH